MNGKFGVSRIDLQVFWPFPLIRQALVKNDFSAFISFNTLIKGKYLIHFLMIQYLTDV